MEVLSIILIFRYFKQELRAAAVRGILFRILLICLLLVALINFLVPLPGADVDAIDFQNLVQAPPKFDLGSAFFIWLLKFQRLFSLTSISFNVVPSILFCSIIFLTLRNIRLNFLSLSVILLFLSNPFIYIFSTTSLRESYQAFFLFLVVYNWHGSNFIKYGLPSLIFLSFLHKGLLIFGILILIYRFRKVAYLLTPLMYPIVLILVRIESRGLEVLRYLVNGDILFYMNNYRSSLMSLNSNTSYSLVSSSYFDLFLGSWIAYNFRPLLTMFDYSPFFFLESIIRLILVFLILIRKKFNYIFFLWVALGFVWSLGTTNYGQIVRHHVMHDFLLIMALYYDKEHKYFFSRK